MTRLATFHVAVEASLSAPPDYTEYPQIMNVIGFIEIEHDVVQKPVPTFWHHALARSIMRRGVTEK